MGQSKETTWVCRQDPSSLQSSIDTKQEDSTNTRDSANPHRVALQAHGQAEQPTSRLIGYQRRDGSKLTLEQEWAAIRKEYNVPAGTRVFTMDGNFPGVRDALLDRGWVEHHEPDSRCFDLKWTIKTGAIDFSQLQPQQIVNHFKKNRAVTTKVGLARSLRELKWFEEIDSDSFFPRSYDLDDMEEVQTFTEDFMLVAAQNELRAFLEADAQDAKHRLQTAQLALIACEDFVRHWQADYNESDEDDAGKSDEDSETAGEVHNEKTGRETSRLSAEEWSLLLGEDCPIAAIRFVVGGDTAETCRQAVTSQSSPLASFLCGLRQCGVLPPRKRAESAGHSCDGGVALEGEGFRSKATSVLAQIQQMLGPQAGINGRDNLWIVKPASKSRGRGIQVVQRLGQVLALVTDSRGSKALCNERWVVQKYVENPLLIDGRKFDIRQWVLVSDWNPLTVWLYEQCYLRFALETYGTDDRCLANRRAHLCNNCVQRDAPDFEAQRAESMWPLERFRAWLLESYGSDAWEHVVLPQVRNIASWAVMCAQDVLENRKDSCELYGYDLVLDDQLKVWLLEVNSSPDMGPTTHVTEKLCYACLYDTVRVMVDYKSAAAVPSRLGQTKSKRTEDVGPEHEESESSKLTQRLPGHVSKHDHCTSSAPESGRDCEGSAVGSDTRDTHFDLDLDPLLSSRGDGDALGTAGYAAWQRGVGGADGKEIGLKEKNCNTGGWCLIHRGEVEVSMPAALACKLTVTGRKIRIHRTGQKELYDTLGFEGTVKRSALKLAGCAKVYPSRTEMLRELNTTGIPTHDALRRQKLQSLKRKTLARLREGKGDGPDVLERMREWQEKKKSKILEQLRRVRAEEEAEMDASRRRPRSSALRVESSVHSASEAVKDRGVTWASKTAKSLTSLETDSLLSRMQADTCKRAARIRDHDQRILEGMRKLHKHLGVGVADGGKKHRKTVGRRQSRPT